MIEASALSYIGASKRLERREWLKHGQTAEAPTERWKHARRDVRTDARTHGETGTKLDEGKDGRTEGKTDAITHASKDERGRE